MATLEMALSPIVSVKSLGASYKELRSLRPLLFAETSHIASKIESQEDFELRPSTVYHHLLSRAPPELQSPHQLAGWTELEYSMCIANYYYIVQH